MMTRPLNNPFFDISSDEACCTPQLNKPRQLNGGVELAFCKRKLTDYHSSEMGNLFPGASRSSLVLDYEQQRVEAAALKLQQVSDENVMWI